jgi:hypothetical protein
LSLTVQLLQGELFGFSDEAENHEPSDEVETGVEADYSCGQYLIKVIIVDGYSHAPVGVMTVFMRGKVKLRIPARNNISQIELRDLEPGGLTEGVVNANGPSHALLTLDRGEDFGRVLEGHRAFTQRVADREQVDEPLTS